MIFFKKKFNLVNPVTQSKPEPWTGSGLKPMTNTDKIKFTPFCSPKDKILLGIALHIHSVFIIVHGDVEKYHLVYIVFIFYIYLVLIVLLVYIL